MDESVVKHLKVDTKVKLSDDVRMAAKLYPERSDWQGCALGSVSRMMGNERGWRGLEVFQVLAWRYRVPMYVLRTASSLHCEYFAKARSGYLRNNGDQRLHIADWLERIGY